jgi:porin
VGLAMRGGVAALAWMLLSARAFGDDAGLKQSLRDAGFALDLSAVQFEQGIVSGEGDERWETGGRLNAKLDVDATKLGLWDGFSATLIGEYNYGHNVNYAGATLFPQNTALGFPESNQDGADLSVTLTQKFNPALSATLGKFNMLEMASRTPLLGGGGINTFWNTALAAPVTGLVPPYVTGASVNVTTKPALFTLMIYDPRNAQQQTGLDDWGKDGVTWRMSLMLPTKFGGRSGYHTLQGVYSTSRRVDLSELGVPPGTGATIGTKKGSYFVSYSVQQYLWQDPDNPRTGWGLFGQIGVSDRNPDPIAWMTLVGLAGNGLVPGRSADRFGVGYFRYSFSDDLTDGLGTFGIGLRDEQGIEIFYNAAMTSWLRVTADVQFVEPGTSGSTDATFVGFSAQILF